ncbi:ATP-binding protein [Candidatus Babeliales bacterium]|nr:ATP-binding protein [Candidatus Babeliales bacterium]
MEKKLKKLPIGIQGFRQIIENDYLYVDKTKYLYNLIKSGQVYFLSRPRRFGKSLTCSTFEEIFAGNKELFKGLYIYNSDYEWKKHPIIKISFSGIAHDSKENFLINLNQKLIDIGNQYNINLSGREILNSKIEFLIKELAKNFENNPVLIVDEYDYPLVANITKLDLAQELREVLQAFYNTVKTCSENLNFIFITGVSKFSRTSIFSSMNNLKDISLDERVSTSFGYTKKEILENFTDYITRFAEKKQITNEQIIQELTEWYDGYCFQEPPYAAPEAKAMADRPVASDFAKATTDKTEGRSNDLPESYKIYNPFSILLALDMQSIDNYWFQSGTPTFLINLIKEQDYPILKLEEKAEINKGNMCKYEIGHVPLENLLFQTGYLTITDYNKKTFNFTLGYPNQEVRLSFTKDIIESMTKLEVTKYSNYIEEFRSTLFSNDLEDFFKAIHTFFASIPYDIQINSAKKKTLSHEKQMGIEKYYQSIFYVTMKLVGANVQVENRTNIGRIDAVVKTNTHVYIIEFKINKTSDKALDQIHDRKYYEKFRLENKKLVLIGLNFDLKEKNILESDWVVQEL